MSILKGVNGVCGAKLLCMSLAANLCERSGELSSRLTSFSHLLLSVRVSFPRECRCLLINCGTSRC